MSVLISSSIEKGALSKGAFLYFFLFGAGQLKAEESAYRPGNAECQGMRIAESDTELWELLPQLLGKVP